MAQLIIAGIQYPQMAFYAAVAFCGVNAAKEVRNALEYNKLPNEANISNQQDLSGYKDTVVLLKGFLSGQDISDELTLANEARRCFQELTITHSFNVERVERVEHLHPTNVPGLHDRTYTNETRIERFSNSVTSKRVSAMSLGIFPPNGSEIRISIASPDQETNIVGHEHSSTLTHSNSIHQASLRCNYTARQEDSTYSISEKYLETGKEVSVLGKLLVHSQTGRADRFEIVESKLISIKTKDQLVKKSKANGVISTITAAVFTYIGIWWNNRKKN